MNGFDAPVVLAFTVITPGFPDLQTGTILLTRGDNVGLETC